MQSGSMVNSYIEQCPILRTGEGALRFTSWPTCSIEHDVGFSGKYPATLQCMREEYLYTNIQQCLQPGMRHLAVTLTPLRSQINEWSISTDTLALAIRSLVSSSMFDRRGCVLGK